MSAGVFFYFYAVLTNVHFFHNYIELNKLGRLLAITDQYALTSPAAYCDSRSDGHRTTQIESVEKLRPNQLNPLYLYAKRSLPLIKRSPSLALQL